MASIKLCGREEEAQSFLFVMPLRTARENLRQYVVKCQLVYEILSQIKSTR